MFDLLFSLVMSRSFFLLLAGFAVLPASAAPLFSTQCQIAIAGSPILTGSGDGSCDLSANTLSGNYYGTASAFSLSTLPSRGDLEVGLQLSTDALPSGDSDPAFLFTGSSYELFRSTGALRSGIIQFRALASGLPSGNAKALVSDGTHMYSDKDDNCSSCVLKREPFTLGTVFSALAYSQLNGQYTDDDREPQSGALISFQLFEQDGVTVVPFQDAPVPEPPTARSLSVVALAVVCLGISKNLRPKTAQ